MAGTRLGAFFLLLAFAAPAAAKPPAESPEAAIRATVARWYQELAKRDEGRWWSLAAPGFIDASPPYERGAATTFVLERGETDGRWRILAHQSSSQGIPPNRVTDPMPDLRALFYATEGKGRDPAQDAKADPRM